MIDAASTLLDRRQISGRLVLNLGWILPIRKSGPGTFTGLSYPILDGLAAFDRFPWFVVSSQFRSEAFISLSCAVRSQVTRSKCTKVHPLLSELATCLRPRWLREIVMSGHRHLKFIASRTFSQLNML